MREIDEIIVHCSATPKGRAISTETIKRWHLDKGWADIGYHYVIELDGSIEEGRDVLDKGAHCYGRNSKTIGVCYVGGCDENMNPLDTRTKAQKESLLFLLNYLKNLYPITKISGHRDYSSKACPSFDATEEYKNLLK